MCDSGGPSAVLLRIVCRCCCSRSGECPRLPSEQQQACFVLQGRAGGAEARSQPGSVSPGQRQQPQCRVRLPLRCHCSGGVHAGATSRPAGSGRHTPARPAAEVKGHVYRPGSGLHMAAGAAARGPGMCPHATPGNMQELLELHLKASELHPAVFNQL